MNGVREAEIVSALASVRTRIHAACRAAARDPEELTLVAVTKTFPATDVMTLVRLGVADIGENTDQEARAKIADLQELAPAAQTPAIRWHMVGRLQTNKARTVVRYAHAVHSVDRDRLVTALADAARERRQTPLEIFVQVSLDDDPARGGVSTTALLELADLVAGRAELKLRGVMAVPPIEADPDTSFARLAELSAAVRAAHPGADAISAGMSADLEAAVRHGSTHLRIGSALLGRRAANFS